MPYSLKSPLSCMAPGRQLHYLAGYFSWCPKFAVLYSGSSLWQLRHSRQVFRERVLASSPPLPSH